MRFVSTRSQSKSLSFLEAVARGLAEDGGLYVPEKLPHFDPEVFCQYHSLLDFAVPILSSFVTDKAIVKDLSALCQRAINFPTPLVWMDEETAVLELFHGPTAAFKDVGARFLAQCLSRIPSRKPVMVLVGTSGDTGGAVASSLEGQDIRTVLLFPDRGVSPFQWRQLTCWGKNVRSLAVINSDFDRCQKLVKEAFVDPQWQKNWALTSANSINIARILAQVTYYAASSVWFHRKTGKAPGFLVPSGNAGNALSAVWAKCMGFPIREIVLVTNVNRSIPDYFATGKWQPRSSTSTLANAMDVGNPSNMERLFFLLDQKPEMRQVLRAYSVSDDEIRQTIAERAWGQVWCPHTATAVYQHKKLGSRYWIIAATAHPGKFREIVEPLVGEELVLPPALRNIMDRPQSFDKVAPDLESVRHVLFEQS